MLVKKTKSEWKPSENLGLQVGDTIDITDPQQLILDGYCIGVSEDGKELDAFDLYGVVDKDLVDEMKSFKEAKHQEQVKKHLEAEREDLEEELAALKKSNAKKYEAVELESMSWQDLRKKAIAADVFKPAMKKKQVIEALSALVK